MLSNNKIMEEDLISQEVLTRDNSYNRHSFTEQVMKMNKIDLEACLLVFEERQEYEKCQIVKEQIIKLN